MTQKNQKKQSKKQSKEQSFFYHYSQNNSFGVFDRYLEKGIGPDVIIAN